MTCKEEKLMKKILTVLGAILCIFLFNMKAEAYQVSANVKTKRIPIGTKLELEMANPILSQNIAQGDMFTTYLTRDVRTTSAIILPKGTPIRGTIGTLIEPKMLRRPATVYLNFDHVVAPNGQQIPISAGLCEDFNLDSKGGIVGLGNYKTYVKGNWTKSGDIIKKTTKWGITSGEDLFKGGKYLVTPFAAIGGSVAGAGYLVGTTVADLFKKGNEVYIKKGQIFNILVLEPLDIPVSE